MLKRFLSLIGLLVFSQVAAFQCLAQNPRLQARELEWKAYAIPDSPFTRMIAPEKAFVLRVPADWKQAADGRTFTGPSSANFEIFVEKVPEGTSLTDYVGMILKAVDNLPGGADSALVRKTLLQDAEAREILLQMPDPAGELSRTCLWLTIRGAVAIALKFMAPLAQIAELEPYFKAIVQSVTFISSFELPSFDSMRSTALKDSKPAPVREIQTIVSGIVDEGVATEANVARLTDLLAQNSEIVVDLLKDRRPFVRMAAVEALARSGNASLNAFLWEALDDPEPLIASYAAQPLAKTSDVIPKLTERTFGGFRTELLARIWPFLAKPTRIQLLQTIFNRPVTKPNPASKPRVSVSVTELIAVVPGQTPKDPPPAALSMEHDPSVQLGALTLLKEISSEEFKLPLSVILASNQDTLTVAALQVAIERREVLAVDTLLKLVPSPNLEIAKLAAANLGLSGEMIDIPKIQALVVRPKPPIPQPLADELNLAIEKITFRKQLSSASNVSVAEEQNIIKKGLADARLDSFVWLYVCERTPQRCGIKALTETPRKEFNLHPFGDNVLPEKVLHFAAIRNAGDAIQKLYETFRNIQMDSARVQSNLVLMMGFLRQQAGQQLGALNDTRPLIEYTGIKSDAPIAVASWAADGATPTISAARRQGMVLRIKNPQQFERFVAQYQRSIGAFSDLPHYIAVVVRMMPALPAFLPFTAQTVVTSNPARPRSNRITWYSAVENLEWNGFQIRRIEYTTINETGRIERSPTYITYIGDAALVAPDLATIRELLGTLARKDTELRTLADNAAFQRVVQQPGEVVYFSDISKLSNIEGSATNKGPSQFNESGQLRISKSTWENTHRLTFNEGDWSKPLNSFQAGTLTAPRSVLPASTLAYLFLNLDARAAWTKWLTLALSNDEIRQFKELFAGDLEADVLEHLGPECGVGLLDGLNLETTKDLRWRAFFKLKSDKLKEALTRGTLFRGIGPTTDIAEIKFGNDSFYVTVQKGFLLVSNQKSGLSEIDTKELLVSAPDYAKSVARVPGQVIAFGGYNLATAIATAKARDRDGLQSREAEMILSLTEAFHSQSFFATLAPDSIDVQTSVSMDREGRYSVADLNYTRSSTVTYVTVDTHGVAIADQKRLNGLILRLRTRTAGAIEAIRKDISAEGQVADQKSAEELLLTIAARKVKPDKQILLPVTDPAMSKFLTATPEIQSTSPQVVKQAREIAGNDKNAWSVARKLADWTYKNLEWKLTARADANQTLATREADCSEFSQLFVAMARSLGLPARIVSGLAHSGGSFGGHAWVEVWCGRWIELDPTWGTDFVDATHIRSKSDDLLTYAALNTLDLEVIETSRTIADFQQTPKLLVEQLIKTLPNRDSSVLETVLNLELSVDEAMGKGEWKRSTPSEKEQLSSAFRRAMIEILVGYAPVQTKHADPAAATSDVSAPPLRLLGIDENGDRAVATLYYEPNDMLLNLHMLRSNGGWHLMEVAQADVELPIISETLEPAIRTIQARRAGHVPNPAVMTDFVRAILLLESNRKKAIEILDSAIKANPTTERLRLLKATALMGSEDADKPQAIKLLKDLVAQPNPYAPAMYRLAQWFRLSEDENERKQVIGLLTQYVKLEPYDIRAHSALASAYSAEKNNTAAEASYRKVIEIEPVGTSGYLDLAEFLAVNNRIAEVSPVLDAADKYKLPDHDLFGELMDSLYLSDEYDALEQLAARYPARMRGNSSATIALANVLLDRGHALKALPLLKLATTIDKKSPVPYAIMANAYRQLSRWSLALAAADQAISRNSEYASAHLSRACALARLRRTDEAIQALKRTVKLGSYYRSLIAEEKDLQSLASHPEFKKLLVEPEKKP